MYAFSHIIVIQNTTFLSTQYLNVKTLYKMWYFFFKLNFSIHQISFQIIHIEFTHFDLAPNGYSYDGDTVTLYDGPNSTAPELTPSGLSGSSLNGSSYNSSGSEMMVLFRTDTKLQATGFNMDYIICKLVNGVVLLLVSFHPVISLWDIIMYFHLFYVHMVS